MRRADASVEGTADCSTKCTTAADIFRTESTHPAGLSTWPNPALPRVGWTGNAGQMKAILVLAAVILLPAAAGPPAAVPRPGWSWPLSPKPAVLRAFDPPDKPWMSGHRGVDLGAMHDGAPVTSPASGTVSFVGMVVDRPVITIDHGGGLRSSFEPVESVLTAGEPVEQGQTIGTLQPGHCASLACVHWGVRRGDAYVNPLEFVTDLRPSILLPVSNAAAVSRTDPAGRADTAVLDDG